ncbi:hypothetical protein Hanom_Chr02g00142891 [Helianthus anomalus]
MAKVLIMIFFLFLVSVSGFSGTSKLPHKVKDSMNLPSVPKCQYDPECEIICHSCDMRIVHCTRGLCYCGTRRCL